MDAAISSAPPDVSTSDRLEQAGFITVVGFAAALQFSIAGAQSSRAPSPHDFILDMESG